MSVIEKSQDDILAHLKSFDILTVCRTCLSHRMDSFPVVSLCDNQLYRSVPQFLELQFIRGDGLPDRVCSSCVDQFSMVFKFKEQCKKASAILHEFVKSNSDLKNIQFKNNKLSGKDNNTSKNEYMHKKIKKTKLSKTENPVIFRQNSEDNINDDSMETNDIIDCAIPNNFANKNINISNDTFHNKVEPVIQTLDSDNSLKISNVTTKFRKVSHLLDNEIKHKVNDKNSDEDNKLHSSENYLNRCSICGDNFSTTRGLHIHARIHTQSESLLCSACGQNFTDSKSLREHSLTHTGDKPFKCSYCDRKFAQKKPLQYHERTHTGERPYACDLCDKSYIQPNNLVIHMRSHTGEKPFVCKECGKAFTNGASLTLHMPVHTGVKDFVCTICGKRMARSGELTIHMRTHTGEKPYVCRTCSKAFIKKSSLQAHMYSHTGEKKFVCPTCGHRVAHAGKLTVHMRTHSNNKPFACPVCDRRFANQGYLKQHSKIHFGDRSKPFTCSECGKAFVKNRNLTEHMRTHTGERPYKCVECNHGFSQKSTLNYHVKKTHSKFKLDASDTKIKPDKLKVVDNEELCGSVKLEVDHKKEDVKNRATKINSVSFPSIISAQQINIRNSVNQDGDGDVKSNFDSRIHFDSRILGFPPYQL